MTIEKAEKLGYRVVAASPFEVGLIKGDKGVRTWFAQHFNCLLPPLDHPAVQAAIKIHEEYLQHHGGVAEGDE